jgi:multiple sugar transport system substrate-binding protein
VRRTLEIASGIVLTTVVAVAGLAVFTPTVTAAPKINWLAVKTPMQIESFKKIFADFTKDTGIKVSPTPCKYSDAQDKMLLASAAGRMFEMVTSGTDFVHYADIKTLVPLDKYIKADKYDTSKQSKIALRSFTYKKQLWGMPYASYPVVLFYNKNLFDKAGVSYPTTSWEDKSWNWEAFLDAARKLTVTGSDGKIAQAGISGMQWHYFWPWYFGGDWSDEDAKVAKLNDPKTAKGIQEVADLWLKYKVADQGGSFNSNKAAMTVDGVWTMSAKKAVSPHVIKKLVLRNYLSVILIHIIK